MVLLARSNFAGVLRERLGIGPVCLIQRVLQEDKWFQGMRMRKTTAADRERAGRPAGSLFCRDL
jgi:hypothetical protein